MGMRAGSSAATAPPPLMRRASEPPLPSASSLTVKADVDPRTAMYVHVYVWLCGGCGAGRGPIERGC